MAALERAVEIIRDARQIAHVLKQREQREKYRHRRQHHRHHPREHPVRSLGEQPAQPIGRTERREQRVQRRLPAREQPRKQLRRVIRADDCQVQHQREQRQHHRVAQQPPRDDAVNAPVAPGIARGAPHAGGAHALALRHYRRDKHILQPLAVYPLRRKAFPLRRRKRRQGAAAQLAAEEGVDAAVQRIVVFQQTQAEPARAYPPRAQPFRRRQQRRDCGLNRRGVRYGIGFRRGRGQHFRYRGKELFPPGARPRRYAQRRHAQPRRQRRRVHLYPLPRRLIDKIDAHECAPAQLQRLQNKIHIPLKTARVADDDDRVRAAEADKIARSLFLRGARHQRIAAGEIDQQMLAASAARVYDGLARPVSRMLVQPGEAVENRALADVRIPGQRDNAPARAGTQFSLRRRTAPGGASGQAHVSPSSAVRRMMLRQSSRRSASTAPRTINARGSPPGLTPTHSMRAPGVSPISSRRRRIPQPCSSRTSSAVSPGRSRARLNSPLQSKNNTRFHHQYIARRRSGFIPPRLLGRNVIYLIIYI